MFKKIQDLLLQNVTVRPMELAGRGSRFAEEPYADVSCAVNDLYQKISGWIDQEDYCIMGFSMGGILTFELCRKIGQMGRKLPSGVFFLGVEPPHIKSGTEYHKLDDREFRQAMISIGGIPEEVSQCEELFDIYLPALRADFQLCETYCFTGQIIKFDFNFYLINGLNDSISRCVLDQWAWYCKKCQLDFVPGVHFFINTNTSETCRCINKGLKEILNC